ncbi:MAG: peroxidase [Planctomycetes bacterium]|nr:peroxidase [Planctomycetota bacterium]
MSASFPSIDGTGNNLTHPLWGSVDVNLIRIAPAAYADGLSAPAGADRPSARVVSNALAAQDESTQHNARELSDYIYAWGQFLDHDIDLTPSASPSESFNVAVPLGDPSFDPFNTGTQVIPLKRSLYDTSTGDSQGDPRQQVNTITAWIDGSQVYGSDADRAAALRTFSGGQMKTSDGNLLPLNEGGTFPNANDAHIFPDDQLFLAGDVRANENTELTAMQTLFIREHNRVASLLAKKHPAWSDEDLFQHARLIVIGEMQQITYNEFLPALLGDKPLAPYRGYKPGVNPGITNEFSTAAFRFGHSLLNDDVEFLDNNGEETSDEISLAQAFFNPQIVKDNGIDGMLKYLASDNAQELDNQIVDSLRNFLFGPPGSGGLDLASLNIQRGRDHGLADYNSTRAAYGLPRVTGFNQITSDPDTQQALADTYGSVDNIDLWVGLLAEDHLPGASVGALTRRIIVDQFTRIRDGDRFWYQNALRGDELAMVRNTRLSDVIRRNTTTTNLQDNVFFFKTQVSGTIYADANGDGKIGRTEKGLPKQTIQLLDESGAVIATTTSDPRGGFGFDHVGLGEYTIRRVTSAGASDAAAQVTFTRGDLMRVLLAVKTPVTTQAPVQTQPPTRPPLRPTAKPPVQSSTTSPVKPASQPSTEPPTESAEQPPATPAPPPSTDTPQQPPPPRKLPPLSMTPPPPGRPVVLALRPVELDDDET